MKIRLIYVHTQAKIHILLSTIATFSFPLLRIVKGHAVHEGYTTNVARLALRKV